MNKCKTNNLNLLSNVFRTVVPNGTQMQINKQIFQIEHKLLRIPTDLNQGPPDFKSSALNHSATPPALPSNYCEPVRSCIECCTPYLTQSQFLLDVFFRHLIRIMLKHQLASTAQLQRMKLYKILMSIGHLQSLKQAKQTPRSCRAKLSRVSDW